MINLHGGTVISVLLLALLNVAEVLFGGGSVNFLIILFFFILTVISTVISAAMLVRFYKNMKRYDFLPFSVVAKEPEVKKMVVEVGEGFKEVKL